ncbi:MAG: class I SAM-dependent methyltransferase [Bacteroidales bacterium]|nr:class I SAM-dependent methyltransferase [Bacteroidales bacterium]
MNSRYSEKLRLTGLLVDFLLHSSTRYNIHSPYLYSLIDQVICDQNRIPEIAPVELLRRQCLRSDEVILKTDYGAGAVAQEKQTYPVKLSALAGKSLTKPSKARRLFRLARFLRAGRILEIGTSLGITTAYLALSDRNVNVVTLEGCPELSRKAKEHFLQLGLHNVELLTGPFSETLVPALHRLGKVDLVYIDGHHRGNAMLDYFDQCLPFTTNETVIVFDDIRFSLDMEKAWKTVCQRQEVRASFDFFNAGWVLFRKELSRQHFRLRYF